MNRITNAGELTTYADHYRLCRELYGGPISYKSPYSSVYDFIYDEGILEVGDQFDRVIQRIADAVSYRFDYGLGCRRYKTHIELSTLSDIEEMTDLVNLLLPQIEQKIYRSYVVVHSASIQRNIARIQITKTPLGSWMWHYDDCPDESIKIVIYLSDVSNMDGPLQVLTGPEVPRIQYPSSRIGPSVRDTQKVAFPLSRIPSEVIDDHINEQDGPYSLIGDRGTYALFSPNQPHRATFPSLRSRRVRDALFLVLRPVIAAGQPAIQHSGVVEPPFNVKEYELN